MSKKYYTNINQIMPASSLVEKAILLEETVNRRGFCKSEVEQKYNDVFRELLNLYELAAVRLSRRKKY